MQLFDPNNPNEKKKMIAAAVLALVAVVVLAYVFFGGSTSKPSTNQVAVTRPSPSPRPGYVPPPVEDRDLIKEVSYNGTVPAVSEGSRNIFAYYEPPPP